MKIDDLMIEYMREKLIALDDEYTEIIDISSSPELVEYQKELDEIVHSIRLEDIESVNAEEIIEAKSKIWGKIEKYLKDNGTIEGECELLMINGSIYKRKVDACKK